MKKLATLSLILCLGISSVWAAPGDAQPQDPAQGQTSIDSASPNRISEGAPCPTYARQFLIRGSYDSSEIGSRLWNLAKVHKASAPNDPEKTCLEEVLKQADSDEKDYWDYIAKKYKCEDDHGKLPKERPASCPEAKWTLIVGSVNWLKVLDEASSSVAQGTGANGDCPPPPSSFGGPLRTIADVTGAVKPGAHPEPVQRTINSGASLGTILAQQQPNHCSLIKDKSKLNQAVCTEFYKDDKSCGAAPSAAKDAEKCVAGLFKGIFDNIKDIFLDTYHLIKGVGSKILAFIKAIYKGGVGTVAREYAFHPKEVAKHVWDALKAIPDAIMNMAATQMQTWQCYNNAARWDMGCSAVGYLGMDALMFVPGFQELAIAKLGKLPVIGKALDALEVVSEATIGKASSAVKRAATGGAILVGEGIVKAGEVAYKILKWVGKAASATFKKLTWFRDASTGLEVAKDGGKVLVKVGENVEEIDSVEEAAKFDHAIENAEHNRSLAHQETSASRKIAEENAAEKGGTKAATHDGEAPQPGDASVPQPTTEEPKKGFFRRALDNYKDPDRKLKQMEIKLSKETAPLPEGYVKDPVLPPTATLEEKAAQLQENGERAANFLGMKTTEAGEATIKDAKGVEQTFKLSEDGDGVGWFTKGKLPDKIKPDFTVNINIPPEKMAKALPGVLSRAEYRGAETYFIGGSSKALENGGRLMISFGDAKEAKRFQESVEFFLDRNFYSVPSKVSGAGFMANAKWAKKVAGNVVSLTVNRPVSRAFKTLNWGVQATVESSVLGCFDNASCQRHVYTSGTVFNDAKLKCNQDNLCICKLYFQAGINPDNDEPIETSPFTCTTASVNPNPGTEADDVDQQYTGADGQAIQLQGTTRAPETPEQMAARLKLEHDQAAGLGSNDPEAAFDAADSQYKKNPNGNVQPIQGKP